MEKEDSNDGGGEESQPEKTEEVESKAAVLDVKEESQDASTDKPSPSGAESPSSSR